MTHGSILYDIEVNVYQAIGIPHPEDLIPVIPKYKPCISGSWCRDSLCFCRILARYGPLGVRESISRLRLTEVYDPIYNSFMPYIDVNKIVKIIDPRHALERIIKGGYSLDDINVDLLNVINIVSSEAGINSESLGLTGSIAAGIASTFSDIDLIVYGGENALSMLDFFLKHSKSTSGVLRSSFGGLEVEPGVDVRWRRGYIKGVSRPVSWVAVPNGGNHCHPLNNYWQIDSPSKAWIGELVVRGGQTSAIMYPPCVVSEEGLYVVSFEYNVAFTLYRGGVFRVKGLLGHRGSTIYLGLREFPGGLFLISR